jgi:predicted deacetylase
MVRAIVSIHDVMPETMDAVHAMVDRVRAMGISHVTLLVVPGRNWQPHQIADLKRWQRRGIALAAHGWSHQTGAPRRLYHRFHSALLSRRAAEHLPLDAKRIAALMGNSHAWFADSGLDTPRLYVPPAWAIGAISRECLRKLPFRWVETLSGIMDTRSGRFRRLALVGFEADTYPRAAALRIFNTAMLRLAPAPLRVAIHPQDSQLRLGGHLDRVLASVSADVGYDALG